MYLYMNGRDRWERFKDMFDARNENVEEGEICKSLVTNMVNDFNLFIIIFIINLKVFLGCYQKTF